MGFSTQPSEINADAVVLTFDREGMRFALKVATFLKNGPVRGPEFGAIGDVGGFRKLRIQSLGRFGAAIAQRPSADFRQSNIVCKIG